MEVRDSPIIFSPHSVNMIRSYRKTLTRRLIKRLPAPIPETSKLPDALRPADRELDRDDTAYQGPYDRLEFCHYTARYQWKNKYGHCWCRKDGIKHPYPYGNLWVRETYCDLRGTGFDRAFGYLADSLNRYGEEDVDSIRCRTDYGIRWRSPILMPRDASRLTLEITGMWPEKLQDINESDCLKEGCPEEPWNLLVGSSAPDQLSWFRKEWDKINGQSAPWGSNPWVWVISFKKVEVR